MFSWNSPLDFKMRRAAPAPRKAWRVGWPTALSIGSAIASDGMLLDMRRWRWEFLVPFPTSFANSPKKTCDHHHRSGKDTPWGVSGFGLGPIPRFHDPPGHLRAVSRALAQFIELSRAMDKQL